MDTEYMSKSESYTDISTYRHTDIQAYRNTDRQTNRNTDRQTNSRTHIHILNGPSHKHTVSLPYKNKSLQGLKRDEFSKETLLQEGKGYGLIYNVFSFATHSQAAAVVDRRLERNAGYEDAIGAIGTIALAYV